MPAARDSRVAPAAWLLLFALASGCTCGGAQVARSHAEIAFDPTSLDFGTQPPHAPARRFVTISNQGSLAITFDPVRVVGDVRAAFQVDPLPPSLAIGAQLSLGVTYAAATEGADGATLLISSNADNAPEARFSMVGRIVSPCPSGQSACDGGCADLGADPANCGTCGVACPTPVHAAAVCRGGACGRAPCAAGFYDLDAQATFGCEATCRARVCTDGAGHVWNLSNDPLPEAGPAFQALASGSSLGGATQRGAGHVNAGVLGEPTPGGVGGAVEQHSASHRNLGGLNAIQGP